VHLFLHAYKSHEHQFFSFFVNIFAQTLQTNLQNYMLLITVFILICLTTECTSFFLYIHVNLQMFIDMIKYLFTVS
jgi:hypothetical protein